MCITIKNFLKTEANEKTIKQTNLFDYEYIVFATHGVSLEDSGNREFTGLALTTPNEISDIDNGFLTYREILKLRLNSKLVLLSACNTALDNDADSNAFSGLVKLKISITNNNLSVPITSSNVPTSTDPKKNLNPNINTNIKLIPDDVFISYGYQRNSKLFDATASACEKTILNEILKQQSKYKNMKIYQYILICLTSEF
jgi:hypothetical protein